MAAAASPEAAPADPRYLDQSASALRLRVYRGPLRHAGLHVLARGCLEAGGWRLHAHVIGASHWLRFEPRRGPSAGELHEVLACVELPREGRAAEAGPGGGLRLGTSAAGGAAYRCDSELLEGAAAGAALRAFDERLAAAAGGVLRLVHRFPSARASSRLGPPRTALRAWRRGAVLEVESAHVYASEERLVLSRTRLAPAGAAE